MTRAQEILNLLEGTLRIALSRDDDGESVHRALGYVEELDQLLRRHESLQAEAGRSEQSGGET